jgi:hypothetical protein
VDFVRRPFNSNAALVAFPDAAAGWRGLLPGPRQPLTSQEDTMLEFTIGFVGCAVLFSIIVLALLTWTDWRGH